jgi:glutathione S-transferase
MSDYRLYCVGESGNCFKVALMLNACGCDWQPVFVDYFNGETRGDAYRQSLNELGEVPVLEHDGERMSQSGAILTHLAAKLGRFGGRDEREHLEILRWILFDNHKFTSYFGTYRFMKSFGPTPPEPAVMAFLRTRIDGAYGVVDKHLESHEFLVGSAPTIADFSLSGYLFYPKKESGYDLPARFPSIAAWVERLKRVPGWADPYEVLPGERIEPKW